MLIITLLPPMMPDGIAIPPKLQPTLNVWTALTLLIELFARKPTEQLPVPG